jgi:hypothetical protein
MVPPGPPVPGGTQTCETEYAVNRLPDPMRWLAAGVPLTLLIDLLGESGPDSGRISSEEAGAADWLSHLAA